LTVIAAALASMAVNDSHVKAILAQTPQVPERIVRADSARNLPQPFGMTLGDISARQTH
jgi:hypothetical protein